MKISVVIPCYNEESCIKIYYNEMEKVVEKLNVSFEYVFVNDGSVDNTLKIIKELALNDSKVKYISFSRNFGKEAAMYAGLKNASGDLVGIMDVDMQDPPELLIDMYNGIVNEGYDCVCSRRVTRKGEPIIRSLFAKTFYKIINRISDAQIPSGARDFRLMTRPMVDSIIEMSEKDRFSKGIFGWVGFNTKWLEYKNIDRVAGKSKWKFRSLVKYALGGIEDFSSTPLKINLFFTYLFSFITLGLLTFMVVYKILDKNYDKMFYLIIIMTFIASCIFFGLAIMSAYIKKIYKETKNRPIYIVKEKNV